MSLVQVVSAAANTFSILRDDTIMEPFTYTAAKPGKGVRKRLLDAFNTWTKVPPVEMEIIAKVVDMLHNASLMLDDIEDGSQLRRGQPAAHAVYGIPHTINSATYIHTLVYKELSRFINANSEYRDLVTIVTDELVSLHHGQSSDMIWRDSFHCPSETEYVVMVKNKTGGLLRLCVRLLMACSTTNTDTNYVPLADLIGVHFQIRDDYMNLQSSEYTSSKGFAEDLDEGKFSFPIIHGVHANPSNHLVLDALKTRPPPPALKTRVINYLQHDTKSFEYTLSVLTTLEAEIFREIAALGGNTELATIIAGLHVERAKF